MITARPSNDEPKPLPRLRANIELALVGSSDGTFPALVIVDPLRNAYFRIDWPQSAAVLLWRGSASIEHLQATIARHFGLATTAEEIAAIVEFLHVNHLCDTDERGGWQRYAAQHAAGQHSALKTALHNYLFLRLPLVRPERFLQSLLIPLAFAYTRAFWSLIALLSAIGLVLAQRQWTAIVAAAQAVLHLEGLHIYAVALLLLKAVHELGHGLSTVRMGCSVPSMGIAVMVGVPVLYTDTTDSWRLSSKSARLLIVYSGVAAELIVATVALLAWSFLPDGTPRQICFALATTSIILSLTINLNPFMRYDGYFALSDHLDVPNLQPRAFDLLVWRLREVLFDLRRPPPEQLPDRLQRVLIIYAALTSIYRLVLFLGIAAVVYVVFGKAIGIILAAVEIGVFILMPIVRETKHWWQLRSEIARRRRFRLTLAGVGGLLTLFFAPVLSTVEAPAVLGAAREEGIFLPFPARLSAIEVVDGMTVAAGDVLFRADARDLEQQRDIAIVELTAVETLADRLHANDKERDGRVIIDSRLARAREKRDAVERLMRQLIIRAPFAGRIVDLDPEIGPQTWLSNKRQLARLVSTDGTRAMSLVADDDVSRIAVGARASFIPDDLTERRRALVLAVVAPSSDGRLVEPLLAERHGGPVPAGDERGESRLRHGWVEVTLTSTEAPLSKAQRGVVRIDVEATSVARLAWRQIARVFVREQSF